jgi:hypothetical protein
MRHMHRAACLVVLAVAAIWILELPRFAKAGDIDPTATASASWGSDIPGTVTARGQGKGNFTVGRDVATVSGSGSVVSPTPPAAISFPYAANSGAGNVGFTATLSGGGTTSTATSLINVGAVSNGFYPYTLSLTASVVRGFFTPSGTATAPGSDPQFFDPASFGTNPTFKEGVTLKAGASVYENGPGTFAETTYSRSSDLLSSPIFSIDIIGSTTGPVMASVYFNPDPNLSFSISASALLAELESSAIGTSGGTTSDIAFSYSWDLSNVAVTSNDSVAAAGLSSAAAVPEPSSLVLGVLGVLGGLGAWCRRNRRTNV